MEISRRFELLEVIILATMHSSLHLVVGLIPGLNDAFLAPNWLVWLLVATVGFGVWYVLNQIEGRFSALDQRREGKISALEHKAEEQPEKVKYAWDLANAKLETYFDRNLTQVRFIFYSACAVMVVGFVFVL